MLSCDVALLSSAVPLPTPLASRLPNRTGDVLAASAPRIFSRSLSYQVKFKSEGRRSNIPNEARLARFIRRSRIGAQDRRQGQPVPRSGSGPGPETVKHTRRRHISHSEYHKSFTHNLRGIHLAEEGYIHHKKRQKTNGK